MLRQPTEAPARLPRAAELPAVHALREVLASRERPKDGSARQRLRALAGAVSGRADRRLLGALMAATDALIQHCDRMMDRVESDETRVADMASAYGEDLARLWAQTLRGSGSGEVRPGAAP
jgi:hypothetical protein